MKLSRILLGTLSSMLTISCLLPLAVAEPGKGNDGRAGSWRKGTQGAPDLKAARARVEKNPKDADALNDLGFALRQNGKLDEAEKYLKQAIEQKPELGQAHVNLSVVYYDQSKFNDALSEAQKAVKIDANQAIFRVVLGNALSKTGDLKGAAQEYKVAIHLQPDYENAHYNLGRVLNEDGQVTDAKFALSKALELDPNDERVLAILDKLEQGESGKTPAAKAGKPKSAASK
ncbi:MAG: tetratricopeptide repeat protein [Candidatus Obscuribacterales bacterium]|nr:tetratricopeptide repeat protein [Candidatus Obscuribacterales bacterium]